MTMSMSVAVPITVSTAMPARATTVVAIAWRYVHRCGTIDGAWLVINRSRRRIVHRAWRRVIHGRGRHINRRTNSHRHAWHAHTDGQAHTTMGLSAHASHQASNCHRTGSQKFCHLGESCLEHHNLLFLIELGRPTTHGKPVALGIQRMRIRFGCHGSTKTLCPQVNART